MSRFNAPPRDQALGASGLALAWAAINKFFKGGFLNLSPDTVRGQVSKSGTASITTGTTSVTITHGCAFTPTIDQITLTPGNNPTSDPGNIWADTIGATTCNANCANNPGASGLDLGWKVNPL